MSATLPAAGELNPARRSSNLLSIASDFVALTRPRVLMLVLLTAPAAMAIGREGWPEPGVLIGVVLGTALIGGGCGALNAWIERERDAKMKRTMDRPLPTGRLKPRQALIFGLLTSGLGLGLLLAVGGGLSATIGALTLLHYIFVYTLWLKPRSPQNIVIGGAAGATAPLIADAAVSGTIGVWSLVLFAIIFLWTPPHFWAIALYRKDEYAAAGFPMMPIVVGNAATRKKMLAYAFVLWPVTLIPWMGGALGPIYGLTALLTGGYFVASIARARRIARIEEDRRVFAISIVYLALLFAVMMLELSLG
ncbi:MAG: protoheme IX farnesyltransferase [Deltaproteobacteria bacterium]|nr:protoheme IX farnesyltransferase [Deltaproteobacteria bacterium]MBW2696102.1 protoheme IX farnesyltransferase [Deltaproteobacteria bacterium]